MTARDHPLRVGVVVPMFPQLSETFIVTKVLALLEAGVDIHVFTFHESPHWAAFDTLAGRDDVRARVHVMPPAAPWSRVLARGLPQFLATAARHPAAMSRYLAHTWRTRDQACNGLLQSIYLRSQFIAHELDILHIEFDAQALGIADLKDFLGSRVLYSARGTIQQLTVLDTNPDACEYLFRYVDGYHFISRFLEHNTRRLGLPAEVPGWLVEPAVDLALFVPQAPPQPSGPPHTPLRIVSVGRLDWSKGYEFALDAVARVRAADIAVEYTIHGAGPYEEPIRYAIRQLGLEDCVQLVGATRREAMPAAYGGADVMVHAALAEGFCNAVIEAQAMELPVVTSDAGGLPENVEHGVTGFVVPRRDPEAMAARIIELAGSPALRERLGKAGRRRALERFDLRQQTKSFLRLYTELAAIPRRPSRQL